MIASTASPAPTRGPSLTATERMTRPDVILHHPSRNRVFESMMMRRRSFGTGKGATCRIREWESRLLEKERICKKANTVERLLDQDE